VAKRIDVSDLDIYYGNFLAVEGVNVSIEPRSITALIGPSGCGKSTFLRSINRMHEVIPGGRVEGKVVMDGQDLYGADVDPVDVRRPEELGPRGPGGLHGQRIAHALPGDEVARASDLDVLRPAGDVSLRGVGVEPPVAGINDGGVREVLVEDGVGVVGGGERRAEHDERQESHPNSPERRLSTPA